jgi:hypothetical protein
MTNQVMPSSANAMRASVGLMLSPLAIVVGAVGDVGGTSRGPVCSGLSDFRAQKSVTEITGRCAPCEFGHLTQGMDTFVT